MTNFSPVELVSLFESIEDNDDKVSALKEQIKVINKDSSERIKSFAEQMELQPSDVKDAYKYYKKVTASGDTGDDYFTLCSAVDTALAHEEDTEDN